VTVACLPALDELLASARVVSIPLAVRFRGLAVREAVIVEGPCGAGEFAPFVEYDDAESAPWLAAAVEAAWWGWPAAVRAEVPVNATVPAVPAAEVQGVLARFDGCRTAKVKVAERGQVLDEDVDRVAAVRAALGPSGRVRVDANGAWSVAEATEALGRLSAFDLEYAEQPCATVDELRQLRMSLARNGTSVQIAADESIRKAADPLEVARLEAADLVVVKVAPLGGVRRALAIVEECGLPAVVSSAIDTSVGIAAGVALATALPSLDHACGLGTVNLLAGDVSAEPLVPRGGVLRTAAVEVDDELCRRFAAPPVREAWWLERLARCHAELTRGEAGPER
jgi:O-succinylbenzoate synthase